MKKDILIFDIEGYGAHFRKFYTNSSSLSYSVPPRTALSGLIAAIMGIDRDTYYDDFSTDKIGIGVKKNRRTRKIMQTLNYLKITSPKHFELPEEHTQIPFEIILGEDGYVSYRLYVSHNDKSFMDELENRIKEKRYYYSPYLGVAPFSCSTNYIDRITGIENETNNPINVSTLIPYDNLEEKGVELVKIDISRVIIMKEKMSCEFTGDRNIKSVKSYIYDENTNPLPVKLKTSYINIKYGGIEEYITFM